MIIKLISGTKGKVEFPPKEFPPVEFPPRNFSPGETQPVDFPPVEFQPRIKNIKFMERALLKMSKPLRYLTDCRRSNQAQYSARGRYLSGGRMRLICFST